MQKWVRGLLYWIAGGFWWLFDRLYGDAIFEKLRPMIPDWAKLLSLDTALDWAISYGPTIGLIAIGGYFLRKTYPNNQETPKQTQTRSPSSWLDGARSIMAVAWTHPGVLGVLAGAVAGWTFVSESWLPIALVTGMAFYVLGRLLFAKVSPITKTSAEQIEINRANDRVRRLNRALNLIVQLEFERVLRTVLNQLIKEQSGYDYDEDISTNNDLMKQRTEFLESYIRLVRNNLENTQWLRGFDLLIERVETEENLRFEANPPPPGVNAYIYRAYAVAMTKKRMVVDYLKSSHAAAENAEMRHLSDLRVHAKEIDPSTFGV